MRFLGNKKSFQCNFKPALLVLFAYGSGVDNGINIFEKCFGSQTSGLPHILDSQLTNYGVFNLNMPHKPLPPTTRERFLVLIS
jgi:hypothetical protein